MLTQSLRFVLLSENFVQFIKRWMHTPRAIFPPLPRRNSAENGFGRLLLRVASVLTRTQNIKR